ncbi:hypothetical protein E5720_16210 [Rhodococcus sp. PAMC28707]|uniref:8-oxoguanine DNA glycosylase OGG fold protein n=1 Tax=unclassified Rhodococcus (in: high G+C Gram-positive bacteria) TaxID=192944 RepID=UPI00109E0D6D|nr:MULTISPECIES: hypothetical protein [unclassified Rhodococcus (in: high G+C Gram-positive bacteria)]QCB52021.1 hypothetical protein E5769_19310 [Rhodococcus sp. PAMC28705]QCB59811.1 hypothetical protein E5720_16210 [Rhodococcus sp. PAMC28707]
MSRLDEGFAPPTACVQWCQLRTYDLNVLDDGVEVDLDWWNKHLDRAGHDIRLRGRNLDGHIVSDGVATVQRNDLRIDTDLADGEHDSLGLLFLCAAWQGSHKNRKAIRRFPDVHNPHLTRPDENPVAKTLTVLQRCIRDHAVPELPNGSWSGWPDTPGVGTSLMATFLWAAKASVDGGRAQLIDQYGVSTLIHEGWLEDPAVTGFTRRRYDRYVQLLSNWAVDIGTSPELIEMWLVQRWSARKSEARFGSHAQPTLF